MTNHAGASVPPDAPRRQVAAFDFDGTICKGDSLIPFLKLAGGTATLVKATLLHLPQLVKMKLTNSRHGDVKQSIIKSVIGGMDAQSLTELGERYAKHLVNDRLLTDAKHRLEHHRSQGHEIVMVSASPDIYLRPVAALLGIPHTITTQLEVVDGTVTGNFTRHNVRDVEKARLLREHFGDEQVELWAYGNSDGDREMLAMADHPYWADRSGRIAPLNRIR